MNRTPLLLIGFTKYTDEGLMVKGTFIVSNMTGNTLYADAGTKLTEMDDAIQAFSIALTQRGRILNYREEKLAARKLLIAKLKILGRYVSDKYPGNVSNWLTSGYDVQTFDNVTQVPGTPTDVKPKDGALTSETLLTFKKQQYANYYEGRHWKATETPPADMTATSKSTKILFEALEVGTLYKFQVRSRGTKGVSNWSGPVDWIVR